MPSGLLIDLSYNAYHECVATTAAAAVRRGTSIIYGAAIPANQVFVSVDILESRSGSANVIEVRSTTRVKFPYRDYSLYTL